MTTETLTRPEPLDAVCRRIETRKTIPAQPERTLPAEPEREEVEISWECPESLLRAENAEARV